jgi:hypothetical protein
MRCRGKTDTSQTRLSLLPPRLAQATRHVTTQAQSCAWLLRATAVLTCQSSYSMAASLQPDRASSALEAPHHAIPTPLFKTRCRKACDTAHTDDPYLWSLQAAHPALVSLREHGQAQLSSSLVSIHPSVQPHSQQRPRHSQVGGWTHTNDMLSFLLTEPTTQMTPFTSS